MKPVIITEYSVNGSLDKILLNERKGIPPPKWNSTKKLINIFGIASGMKYLHSHKILHRDLKPQNILEDENYYPKICDFGLSKMNHSNSNSLSYESSSMIKGTPIYIAPETWRTKKYSPSCDVYAFGIMVYEIISLEVPFIDFNHFELINKVVLNDYRPEIKSYVSKSYRKLIERCWDPNPKNRPTFDLIVESLINDEGFLQGDINESEFQDYVFYIEDYHSSFNKNERVFPKREKISEEETEKPLRKSRIQTCYQLKRSYSDNFTINDLYLIDTNEISKLKVIEKVYETSHFDILSVQFSIIDKKVLKVLKIPENKDIDFSVFRDLFLEYEILNNLDHPNIVKTYGFSIGDETHAPSILIDGLKSPLDEFFKYELSYFIEAKIIFEISSALEYLHTKHIVHRNINPDCVWINEKYEIKLSEFDYAVFSDDEEMSSSVGHIKFNTMKKQTFTHLVF